MLTKMVEDKPRQDKPFKVIQGHQCRYQSKDCIRLPISDFLITCSTVVLQCCRRQAIRMEEGKIRPSVTLYSLDRSVSNFV